MKNLRDNQKIDSLARELYGISKQSHTSINKSINDIGEGIEKIHDGLHNKSQFRSLIPRIVPMRKTRNRRRRFSTSNHYPKSSSYNTSTPRRALTYINTPSI